MAPSAMMRDKVPDFRHQCVMVNSTRYQSTSGDCGWLCLSPGPALPLTALAFGASEQKETSTREREREMDALCWEPRGRTADTLPRERYSQTRAGALGSVTITRDQT